jgi:hypothetical protein
MSTVRVLGSENSFAQEESSRLIDAEEVIEQMGVADYIIQR